MTLSLRLFSADFSIKSLRAYSTAMEGSFPVIIYTDEGSGQLTIDFDVEATHPPDLIIRFMFCDKNWIPYEDYFFQNQGHNTAYNLWFETLPVSVQGAGYHFSGDFPNNDIDFPFSGKWMYFIKTTEDDEIYASGKFYVVKPEVKLFGKITNERMEDFLTPSLLERSYRLTVDFTVPEGLFSQDIEQVEIIENQVIEYPYVIGRTQYDKFRYYEWDASRKFSFIARDIFPGNEYRSVDFRDKRKYFAPTFNANIDGYEKSRTYFYGGKDINGGSRLADFKDPESSYFNVKFGIRPEEKIKNDIFLTGSFNNWMVLPDYKLENNDGYFDLTIELKRGKYDYQFVTGDIVDGYVTNIDFNILEGNFWETKNDYHVFLFHRAIEFGGYDKIIGYLKLTSGVK